MSETRLLDNLARARRADGASSRAAPARRRSRSRDLPWSPTRLRVRGSSRRTCEHLRPGRACLPDGRSRSFGPRQVLRLTGQQVDLRRDAREAGMPRRLPAARHCVSDREEGRTGQHRDPLLQEAGVARMLRGRVHPELRASVRAGSHPVLRDVLQPGATVLVLRQVARLLPGRSHGLPGDRRKEDAVLLPERHRQRGRRRMLPTRRQRLLRRAGPRIRRRRRRPRAPQPLHRPHVLRPGEGPEALMSHGATACIRATPQTDPRSMRC